MNDEIKEILDIMKKCYDLKDENFDNYITLYQLGLLSDYIINLQQANDKLNRQIVIMEKYLELIYDLGFDYDGYSTNEHLKKLIDELVHCASLGRACNTTEPIFTNMGKHYNILHEEVGEKEVRK